MIARRQRRRDNDKLARSVGGRLGRRSCRRRAVRPSAFGAARPAMTASPEGSTFTTSKAGSRRGAVWVGACRRERGARCRRRCRDSRAGGTIGGLDSAGALATTGTAADCATRNPGWVQTTAPAPAATTTKAAAPTQISVFRDGMIARSLRDLYRCAIIATNLCRRAVHWSSLNSFRIPVTTARPAFPPARSRHLGRGSGRRLAAASSARKARGRRPCRAA